MTKAGDLYGQSLYDLALSENLTDAILHEMEELRKIFAENPDYIRLLLEPSIPKKERLRLLDEAFGDSIQPYLLNFLKILTERGMLHEFSACYKRFRASYFKDNGIADALVVSAVPLSDAHVSALTEKLSRMTGKKIILQQKNDPSVMGGLRVEVDGKLLDGTVQGRLDTLRREINETVM